MRDPGGRLGPYTNGARPDVRNLTLFLTDVEQDDFVMITSDGLYDNFDPAFVGKSPKDMNIDADTWKDVGMTVASKIKEEETVRAMTKMFPEPIESATHVLQKLLYHVVSQTAKSRNFMEENPGKKQPTNYSEYPGKMDHCTCAVYKVACNTSLPDKEVVRPSAFAKRNANGQKMGYDC